MAFGDDETARNILTSYKSFAVVGCSARPDRPSFRVALFLMTHGYDVIPINPNECDTEILGQECYEDLDSAAEEHDIDVVDIFRRSDAAGAHVDEAIEIGAKAVWMQLGVIDEDAYRRAQAAGLEIVMDRCPAIDHPRLIGAGRSG